MTVSSPGSKNVYSGNASNTSFPFSFSLPGGLNSTQASALITVTYVDVNGNSNVIPFGGGSGNYNLVVNAPISPNPTSVGGTVTFAPGGFPIPLGTSLIIARTLPSQQGTSLINQGTLWQQAIEQALDYVTMLEQQVTNSLGQAFLAPASDPAGLNYTAPAVGARANKLFGFDANGNVVAISGTAPVGPPVGAQTITSPWTFTGSPNIQLNSLNPSLILGDTGTNTPYYTGTVTGGTATTVTLNANPTNLFSGNPCCNGDSTIVNACISVTGGGLTQVAAITAYNATTRVATIIGNVYDASGNLLGTTFSPIPTAGYTWTIGRYDYGYIRRVGFRFLDVDQYWLNANPASGGVGQVPFASGSQEYRRFNRLIGSPVPFGTSGENTFFSPITGSGAIDPWYICPNYVWNSDAAPQTPRKLSFYTLQSSGDTGNTGSFPPTFPVTYQYSEVIRISPHVYSGGVPQTLPYVWTAFGVGLGVGTQLQPDSQFEVRNNAATSKTPPGFTLAHIVSPNNLVTNAVFDSYGAGGTGQFLFRHASGGAGAETAVAIGNTLGLLGSVGFGTTVYGSTTGYVLFQAGENWTDAHQGTSIIFGTTPNGTVATVEAGRFWASGGLSVGTPIDPGVGGIHASAGITLNGALTGVTSINASATTVTINNVLTLPQLTQGGTLPAANAVPAGTIAHTTGTNAPSWGAILGAGTTALIVVSNGTNWIIMGVG